MIEVGSEIKFNGTVSTVGTGAYTAEFNEFFIDEQWRRFVTPKNVEITTADYDNHLTPSELTFIEKSLERMMKNLSFNECEKAVADSIVKKLKS